MTTIPFVDSILHPTDFSEGSMRAFAHALAIALFRHAKLTLLHVSENASDEDWQHFPPVRQVLERWGLLAPGSKQADVFERLAVKVRKVLLASDDPAEAISTWLVDHPSDLLVLSTEQRGGLPGWLQGSVATKLARSAAVRALFVPAGCRGFVSAEDGELSLRRILVPVDHAPDPAPALEIASRAAASLGVAPVAIRALHAGEKLPKLELADDDAWRLESKLVGGDPVDAILGAAREWPADLVMMATDGRDGPLDVFRGSHTERVAREVPCPLLSIPVPKSA
jgi:nucleotide-binding universal stress UspA family protein